MKIFRRTRKESLSENKFRAYILYALGEIVLVVVGILIAVQLNNWKQNTEEERILKQYLGKIRSHTLADRAKLDTTIYYRSQIAGLCKKARISILDKTEDENLILFMSCGAVFADFYFKPNTGGYEALKNSAYFGKINNTSLDSLLTQYHSLVAGIAENEVSYNAYAVQQEAYLSRSFDTSLIMASAFMPQDSLAMYRTSTEEYFAVYREYTSSIPYRNVIGLAAFQFDTMVAQYEQLKSVGEQVILEIDRMSDPTIL